MSKQILFNGGLMRGQTAHWQLKGSELLGVMRTAPRYRLYSIGDRYPAMLRDDERGRAIAAELYDVPDDLWLQVLAAEPPGLMLGSVELADGRVVDGIMGQEEFVARHGVDISEYAGWADYPLRAAANRRDIDPAVSGFELFVNGTLMRGLKLFPNLLGAPFLGAYRTEPRYRIHSIDDIHPGMYRLEDGEPGGIAVPGELYFISDEVWAAVEAGEPPNLYRGQVRLHDGSEVWGILYPRELAEGKQPEITRYGGWREYLASKM